jgi:hypothetical protein
MCHSNCFTLTDWFGWIVRKGRKVNIVYYNPKNQDFSEKSNL